MSNTQTTSVIYMNGDQVIGTSNTGTMPDPYFGGARVAELWAAIQTALGKKVDKVGNNYVTAEAVSSAIAEALTDYATDAGVKAAITAALADYMTASAVQEAITQAVATAANIRYEAVDTLPETGEDKVIYLVPDGSEGSSVKKQYMWLDGKFELLGSTEMDLSNYWSKGELRQMTSEELQAIIGG